jgi:hypothetical protein
MRWWPPLPCPGCGRRPAGGDGACAACWTAATALRSTAERATMPAPGCWRSGPTAARSAACCARRSTARRPRCSTRSGRGSGPARPRTGPASGACLGRAGAAGRRRQRRRGVDHAAVLAAAVAVAVGCRLPARAVLVRRRPHAPVARPWAQREANLRGAIAPRSGGWAAQARPCCSSTTSAPAAPRCGPAARRCWRGGAPRSGRRWSARWRVAARRGRGGVRAAGAPERRVQARPNAQPVAMPEQRARRPPAGRCGPAAS